MVRINLISPQQLSDQHLIAEYREILMMFGYYRLHQSFQPTVNQFQAARFYHDKLLYLQNRFMMLREEMITRNFKPTKFIERDGYPEEHWNDYEPTDFYIQEMKQRIKQRINEKPTWYRYRSEYRTPAFFEELMK